MKKVLKWFLIILTSCVGLLIALVVGIFILMASNNARTPDEIARKAGVKLPAYRITRSEDNTSRTTSSNWTWYYYEIEFEKPLPESYLRKVERKKTFIRDGAVYTVKNENPDEWYCQVYIYPDENKAILKYAFWDYFFPIGDEEGENAQKASN